MLFMILSYGPVLKRGALGNVQFFPGNKDFQDLPQIFKKLLLVPVYSKHMETESEPNIST